VIRIVVQGQPHISTNKPDVVACAFNSSYEGGISKRILMISGQTLRKGKPYLKNCLKPKELKAWLKW
jgi:hypothetical protein